MSDWSLDAPGDDMVKPLLRWYEALLDEQPDYKAVREEVEQYVIELDPDPTQHPLDRFHERIERYARFRSRLTTLASEAAARTHLWQTLKSQVKGEIDDHVEGSLLLVPEVFNRSNDRLRMAAARRRVPGQLHNLVPKVEQELSFAQAIGRTVDKRLSDLDHTWEALSRQVTIYQTQMQRGEIASRWGHEPPGGTPGVPGA